MSDPSLHPEVSQALVGDVDPERLEAYRFASGIRPVFGLIRSRFSWARGRGGVDMCHNLLKLFVSGPEAKLLGPATR